MAKPTIVLKHPSGKYVMVRRGFSWPAFLFGSLWAIVHRMGRFIALLIVLDLLLWFATGYAVQIANPALLFAVLLANIAYAVIRGRYGNRWRVASLRRSGYLPVAGPQEPP